MPLGSASSFLPISLPPIQRNGMGEEEAHGQSVFITAMHLYMVRTELCPQCSGSHQMSLKRAVIIGDFQLFSKVMIWCPDSCGGWGWEEPYKSTVQSHMPTPNENVDWKQTFKIVFLFILNHLFDSSIKSHLQMWSKSRNHYYNCYYSSIEREITFSSFCSFFLNSNKMNQFCHHNGVLHSVLPVY